MERQFVDRMNTEFADVIINGTTDLKEYIHVTAMVAAFASIYDVVEFLRHNKESVYADTYTLDFLEKNANGKHGVNAWFDKQYSECWDKAWEYFRRAIGHPMGLKLFFDQMNQGMYRNAR
jgi:hypothetical protein